MKQCKLGCIRQVTIWISVTVNSWRSESSNVGLVTIDIMQSIPFMIRPSVRTYALVIIFILPTLPQEVNPHQSYCKHLIEGVCHTVSVHPYSHVLPSRCRYELVPSTLSHTKQVTNTTLLAVPLSLASHTLVNTSCTAKDHDSRGVKYHH